MLSYPATWFLSSGFATERQSMSAHPSVVPFQFFRTGDGFVALAAPKEKFFQNHAMFMLSQEQWIAKAQSASEAQRQRWSSGTFPARWRAIAGDLGFYAMMESRGYTRTQTDQCLANETLGRAIVDQSNAGAEAFGVTGTPSFALNGKLLTGVHTWDTLREAVTPALQ